MAQILLKVGDAPNDRTGDPLRGAGQAINAMFTELYGAVAARALTANLATVIANLSTLDANTALALASKATTSDMLLRAMLTQVVRVDDAVGLTADQRILLGDNSGSMVSLPFVLFQSNVTPVPSTFHLPALPGDFKLHSVYLMFNAAGGSVITAELRAEDNNELIAKADAVTTEVTGPGGARLSTLSTNLFRSRNFKLVITDIDSVAEGYEPWLGATLWLRGAWTRSMLSSGGGIEGGDSENFLGAYAQTVVDFGAELFQTRKEFVVTDARVNAQSIITGNIAYAATDNKTIDEVGAECFELKFAAGVGEFTILATSLNGSVHGKIPVNYHIN